jgi:hypothetical protein
MTTTAYIYNDETGVITPDTSTIQTEVQEEYKNLFGQNLNTDANTPQGVLITTETIARVSVANQNAELANQINPDIAGGVFLDALLALTGSERIAASPSLVYATVSGVAETIIPAGSRAQETNNSAIFATTDQVVIPESGVLYNVEFQSLVNGSIPCLAGSLTQIITVLEGWETVTNPEDGSIGTLQQSDTAARTYRQVTLAAQGTNLSQAIISGLYLTEGVTSVTFQENSTPYDVTINSTDMVPNSLYTCVAGTASSLDIATTLTNKKSGGCAYNNGNGIQIQQIVTDAYSQQELLVLFDRPSILTMNIRVSVNALSTVTDVKTSVKTAIVAYANGEVEYMPGFIVGAQVSPLQIAAAIAQQIPGIFVNSLTVALANFTQQGTLTEGSAIITDMTYVSMLSVGMAVSGEGIEDGSVIISIDSSSQITISQEATISVQQVLTFTASPVYQATEFAIEVWQQAATSLSYITVVSS